MKLVAARCPNCGANIDVDKDSDSTRCEYCKSKIIVEDAIQKVKVEMSGSVEVANSTSVEKLMKIAYRSYQDKDYVEALKKYERALELDPDNALIVLRIGFCRALMSQVREVDIKKLHKSINNACKLVNTDVEEKEFNTYLMESKSVIDLLSVNIRNYIDNLKLSSAELTKALYSLSDCLDVYGLIYSKVKDNDLFKEQIIKKSNELLDYFNRKYSVTDQNMYGYNYAAAFVVPGELVNKANAKREFNRNELFKLKPELKENYDRYLQVQQAKRLKEEEISKNWRQLLTVVGIIAAVIFVLFVLVSIFSS